MGSFILASSSPIKLEAIHRVYGPNNTITATPTPTFVEQPLHEGGGIACAVMRLQSIGATTNGITKIAIESYIEFNPDDGHWYDKVAVVLEVANVFAPRRWCAVGGAIKMPKEVNHLLETKAERALGGFKVTAGKLMVDAGLVKSHDNWQYEISRQSRVDQIAGVLATARIRFMSLTTMNSQDVAAMVRYVPDFPKHGVLFKDISPLLVPGVMHIFFNLCQKKLTDSHCTPHLVVGIESRGFLLAANLGTGFVMARKRGKLPPPVISQEYGTEYSKDTLEMSSYQRLDGLDVLIVDDLVATGGSMLAVVKLVRQLGGRVVGCFAPFAMQALAKETREKFSEEGVPLITL